MSEWRPISEAPRDGTRFIAYYKLTGVRVAHYLDNSDTDYPWAGFVPDYGVNRGGDKLISWMPLPAPPEETE